MSADISRVEDQTLDESNGLKRLISVRNIVIAVTLALGVVGCVLFAYRQEIFGAGLEAADLTNSSAGGEETNGNSLGSVASAEEEEASTNEVQKFVIDMMIDKSARSTWDNFKSGMTGIYDYFVPEKFKITATFAGHNNFEEIEVNSLEKLFKTFVRISGMPNCRRISGISQDLFVTKGGKFILPVRNALATEYVKVDTFEKLIEMIRVLETDDNAKKAGRFINYDELKNLLVLKRKEDAEFKKEYPYIIEFDLPASIDPKILLADLKPELLFTHQINRRVYRIGLKTEKEATLAKLRLLSEYFDASPAKSVGIRNDKNQRKRNTLPVKCDGGKEKKPVAFSSPKEMAKAALDGKLPADYAGCQIDFDRIFA